MSVHATYQLLTALKWILMPHYQVVNLYNTIFSCSAFTTFFILHYTSNNILNQLLKTVNLSVTVFKLDY